MLNIYLIIISRVNMNRNKIHVLGTSKQIIDFVEDLSVFVEHVHIIEIHPESFSFTLGVKVPMWYRYLLGWWLKMKIKSEVTPRLPVAVTFDFKLHN